MKKIIYKIIIIITLSFLLISVIGCGINSVVGRWENQNNIDSYYIFNKNNTGSYTDNGITKNFKYEDRGTKIVITYDNDNSINEFDYSINGDIFTIKDSLGNDITYIRK